MDAVNKIRDDWANNQKNKTRAIEDRPWGWQWGGETVFKQVAALGIGDYLESPVLDVGCGGGKWEKWLIDNYGMKVTGVDVHEQSIKESRAYEPRATYKVVDGETLPFEAGSFGTVFIFDVLLHLPSPLVTNYFIEAYRVARHSLILSLPDMGTGFGGKKYLQTVQRKVWHRLYEYGYMNYYTRGQVARMLNLAGWENVKLLGHIGARGNRDMVLAAVK